MLTHLLFFAVRFHERPEHRIDAGLIAFSLPAEEFQNIPVQPQRDFFFALRRDTVIPANEVLNTLQGDFRDIPVRVEVGDFPYAHNHVIPFPASGPEAEVERSFDRVFDLAAAHLG